MGKNLQIITDIGIDNGGLFSQNGSRNFDVLVVGFSEYVTARELSAYQRFVETGGPVILMDSDNFQVQVGYSLASNHEWLIRGHGWEFDGHSASRGVSNAFVKNDTNWIGSTSCCFHDFIFGGARLNINDPIGQVLDETFGKNTLFNSYQSHEENAVRNLTGTSVIATFRNDSGAFIASYAHSYVAGRIVCFCVFGEDIILTDKAVQNFLLQSLVLATTYFGTVSNSTDVRLEPVGGSSV